MSEHEKTLHASHGTEPTQDQARGTEQHPTMPPGRSDLALKRYENLKKDGAEDHADTSLQQHAKDRAKHHPTDMNAGTQFDWEDVEAYQKELERLDREGSKTAKP